MKKDVINVPMDKCPLDVLAEMGERTKDAWIFLHMDAVEHLQHSDGVSSEEGRKQGTLVLTWKETKEYPKTRLVVNLCGFDACWKPIISISASDIAFTLMPDDPEDIYFLKMAK